MDNGKWKSWIFLLFFLCYSKIAQADVGRYWSWNTPYSSENRIETGDDRLALVAKCHQDTIYDIANLERWYFYDSCTIGVAVRWRDSVRCYFVLDESHCTYTEFTDSIAWQSYLADNSLKPSWTRWYSDTWRFFEGMLESELLILMPIMSLLLFLIVVALYFRIVYLAFRKERFHVTKKYTLIAIAATLILTARMLLDIYPQSF